MTTALERFITALHTCYPDATGEELRDVLWFAVQIAERSQPQLSPDISPPMEQGGLSREATKQTSEKSVASNANTPSILSHERTSETPSRGEVPSLYTPVFASLPQQGQSVAAVPLLLPAAKALPEALQLGRALRPLRRKVPSTYAFELDEAETVSRIADTRLWQLSLKPTHERWGEVELIVDASPSMQWWHATIQSFQGMLQNLGAFRNVRVWQLISEPDAQDFSLTLAFSPLQRKKSIGEILCPGGHRLFLFITDGVAQHWCTPLILNLFQHWAHIHPSAIIQIVPQHLWNRTAFQMATFAWLNIPSAWAPSATYKALRTVNVLDKLPPNSLAIPVTTLEPDALQMWAQALVQQDNEEIPGIILSPRVLSHTPFSPLEEDPLLASEQRIRHFRTLASPTAQRLAELMSAAPIEMPVIHLIRQVFLPEAQHLHIAEFLLGGLLETKTTTSTDRGRHVGYDFYPGIREQLLSSVPRYRMLSILNRVTQYLEERMDQPINFRAFVLSPATQPAIFADERLRPFAAVATQVLRKLGGKFRAVANSIEHQVNPSVAPPFASQVNLYVEICAFIEHTQVFAVAQGWQGQVRHFDTHHELQPTYNVSTPRIFIDNLVLQCWDHQIHDGQWAIIALLQLVASQIGLNYQDEARELIDRWQEEHARSRTLPSATFLPLDEDRIFPSPTVPSGNLLLADICVVCALPEEVKAFLEAVQQQCHAHWEERIDPQYNYDYRWTTIKNDRGEPITLHISWLSRYGPQEMTHHLSRVIDECHPRIAIMTGICAGDPQQVKLGDLVVAERLFTYDNAKFIDYKGRQMHKYDTLTFQLDANILQFLGLFDNWESPVANLPFPSTSPEQRKVSCHIKPMASGEAVRSDHPFADVRTPVRGTVAIDMEGAAFSLVMSHHQQIPWLVIKGVCDYADPNKSDIYDAFAARASALYALSFIQAYVTNERLPRIPPDEPHFQKMGVQVWTATDLRRYQNLREKFVNLSQRFDLWLVSEPRKTGQRIQVLWLSGEEGEHRHDALMACLSGVDKDRLPMYDAGMDLGLFAKVLNELMASKSHSIPPIVSVELSADEHGTAWKEVRNALVRAESQFSEDHQAYPRMIVAGSDAQAQDAYDILQERIEIEIIDTMGRALMRQYSYHGVSSMESRTVTSEDIFNRGIPIMTGKLFGRVDELNKLTQAWNADRCRIISIVAYGGTGKSALVNTWLSQMRDQDYLGARKVFAWSFYDQGTMGNLVSADLFVNQALTWLAPDEPIPLNAWARGRTLAHCIKRRRFLLVLDGLEVLQHPLSAPHVGGQLTDDSIRALLEDLSNPTDWEGLCVITTRVPLTDIRRFEDTNQEGMGRVVQLDLENLTYQDGAALLKSLINADIRQIGPKQRDLEAVVGEVKGHALAITLLGSYLRNVHHGDLTGRFDLEGLTVAEKDGGHARRIMASYARWLQENQRFAELALLRIIGLFDRPVPPEAMSALLAGIDPRRFSAELDHVGSDIWNQSVGALREMGLLNKENLEWPGTLDAHPLIREYFRDEIQKGDGHLWEEGNRVLYAYYRDTAPPQPSDSKGMSFLYAAVTHGCAAGLHQEVFDEVLLKRVWRDRRTNFSTRWLGMTGSDLVALSNYFQHRQWTQLQDLPLTKDARVLILTNAGVRLRQLGRLVEARQCFGAVVREIESNLAQAREFEDASYAAVQYCELQVIAGKLAGTNDDPDTALLNGQRAIEFADRGEDPYFRMHTRSSLAEVYFMLGDMEKTRTFFEQAQAIDQERHPNPPFLYSQSLFRYGYYLIESGRAEELLADAQTKAEWGTNGNDTSLLSRAIRSLILGAAHRAVIESGKRTQAFLDETEKILNDAISEFGTAGYTDYTVRGLLERAHFYRIRRSGEDYQHILADLDLATFEAERGQMDLLYVDILLQRVACYLEFWPIMSNDNRTDIKDRVVETFMQVGALINEQHYHLRDAMLVSLQAVAAQHGILR